VHALDTLLSHEATCGGFVNSSDAVTDARSHDNESMADVVCPDYIHTRHTHTEQQPWSNYSREYAISDPT